MRLSEAIMLGAATCKMVRGDINSCAFGAALNAVGVRRVTRSPFDYSRVHAMMRLWPWVESRAGGCDYAQQIIGRFDCDVCDGRMTLEQLVDYVRSVEPDCDCNRFNCNCKSKQEVATEVEHVSQA